MMCYSDQQLAALAIGPEDPIATDHLASCSICAERLRELTGLLNQLEASQSRADTEDKAGRTRLLEALEPHSFPLIWRIVMNRRNWAMAASAAMIAFIFWLASPVTPHAVALAEALRPFSEAKSFTCTVINLKGGKPWDDSLPPKQMKYHVTWAAPGSFLIQMVGDGKPVFQAIYPHGKPGLLLDYQNKEAVQLDKVETLARTEGNEASLRVMQMFKLLASYKAGDKKPDGTDEIKGVKTPRFDLTIQDQEKKDWHYSVWVNPTTNRVQRVEFSNLPGWSLKEQRTKDEYTERMEDFEWDVNTDKQFDTTIPVGFKNVTPKVKDAEDQSTSKINAALKFYRDAIGGYPKTEPFNLNGVVKDLEKAGKKPGAEIVQGFVLIGVTQAVSKEAVYHGESVTPKDTTKILFRFKLDDGNYRVIYGDLKSGTLTKDEVEELEGK